MNSYKVMQDGVQVARVDANDAARAWADVFHYAMMYAQDGDVEVYSKVGKKWVLAAKMEYKAAR